MPKTIPTEPFFGVALVCNMDGNYSIKAMDAFAEKNKETMLFVTFKQYIVSKNFHKACAEVMNRRDKENKRLKAILEKMLGGDERGAIRDYREFKGYAEFKDKGIGKSRKFR